MYRKDTYRLVHHNLNGTTHLPSLKKFNKKQRNTEFLFLFFKMAYFAFLVEASTDAMLKVFREESSTSVLAEPLEDSDDEDSDKELEEEEDFVEEPDKISGNNKPGQRRYSKTLLRLIHKYDPSLECRSSDISCLLLFH